MFVVEKHRGAMTRSPRGSAAPDHALRDVGECDEGSSVRPRFGRPRQSSWPPLDDEDEQPGALNDPTGRSGRIEQKVRVASLVLDDLPPNDPSVRLLRIAIMRRDEILLDGVLSELQDRRLGK
jgi:hypothetical protein